MYENITIPEAMDKLYHLGNCHDQTEAPDKIAAMASLMPRDVAFISLARLYVIAETRAKLANARLERLEAERKAQC